MQTWHIVLGKAVRGEKVQDPPSKGEMKELQQIPQRAELALSNSTSFILPPFISAWTGKYIPFQINIYSSALHVKA